MHVCAWVLPGGAEGAENGGQFLPLWESTGQPLSKRGFVGSNHCRRFGNTKAARTYHRR
jgi:hypothetical protein